jgi:hypothetical protein
MSSEVAICSQALILLGDQPISSFTDGNDRALACSSLYPQTRDEIIRMHPWNSCIKRVNLSPLVDEPVFEWASAFQIPGDCLRILSIGENGTFTDYRIEGRKILANQGTVLLRYLFRNIDVGTYDAGLMQSLVYAMAWKLAWTITRSAPRQQQAQLEFEQVLRRAKAVDGQEDVAESMSDAPFLYVRSTYGGFNGR